MPLVCKNKEVCLIAVFGKVRISDECDSEVRLRSCLGAPLPAWNDLDQCGHVVQFYADGSFSLEGLSRFIGSALGRAMPAL